MAQRQMIAGQPTWLTTARSALLNDPPLGIQVAGALAGLGGGGILAALALAAWAGAGRAWLAWAALLLAILLGLAVAALAIGDRRHRQHLRRGQRRYIAALTVLSLAAVAAILAPAGRAPWIGVVTAGVVVLAILAVAWWGQRTAEAAARRFAGAHREGWLAQVRASRLTRRMIGYAAYKQLRRDGYLPVKSNLYPHRTYQVPLRTTPSGARILVLEHDRPVGGLCLRPRQPLPDPEEALAHILAIRTDERAWLGRANFFPQDRYLTPQALGLAPGRPGNYER